MASARNRRRSPRRNRMSPAQSPPPPPVSRPQGSVQPGVRRPDEPGQPLVPPLPPGSKSSPPRQGAPNPSPQADPPRDQRYREGEDRDVPVALTPEQRTALVTEPHPPQTYRRPLPQPRR